MLFFGDSKIYFNLKNLYIYILNDIEGIILVNPVEKRLTLTEIGPSMPFSS